jgi:hypothetical protein
MVRRNGKLLTRSFLPDGFLLTLALMEARETEQALFSRRSYAREPLKRLPRQATAWLRHDVKRGVASAWRGRRERRVTTLVPETAENKVASILS